MGSPFSPQPNGPAFAPGSTPTAPSRHLPLHLEPVPPPMAPALSETLKTLQRSLLVSRDYDGGDIIITDPVGHITALPRPQVAGSPLLRFDDRGPRWDHNFDGDYVYNKITLTTLIATTSTLTDLSISGDLTLTGWLEGSIGYVSSAAVWTELGIGTAGQLLRTNTPGATAPEWVSLTTLILGTTNQVTVGDNGDGSVTLSTPQNIHTGASPTFAGLTVSGLTSGRVVYASTGGLLADAATLLWDGATLSVGASDAMTVNGVPLVSQFAVNSNSLAITEMHAHTDVAGAGGVAYFARARGTTASPTIVQNGDLLGALAGVGYDGTDYATGAAIYFTVAGTPGNNDMPTDIVFYTSPDGSQTLTETARFLSDQTATFAGAVRVDSLGVGVAASGAAGDATFSDGTNTCGYDASTGIQSLSGTTSKLGIGTTSVPHGGVGLGTIAFNGPNGSVSGPHTQWTTDADDYPLLHILNWTHDNLGLFFDCYFDGAFRSSNSNFNYMMYKTGSAMTVSIDSGTAAGSAMSLTEAIRYHADNLWINRGRANWDFKVSSQNIASFIDMDASADSLTVGSNVLFVDGANTQVGVGVAGLSNTRFAVSESHADTSGVHFAAQVKSDTTGLAGNSTGVISNCYFIAEHTAAYNFGQIRGFQLDYLTSSGFSSGTVTTAAGGYLNFNFQGAGLVSEFSLLDLTGGTIGGSAGNIANFHQLLMEAPNSAAALGSTIKCAIRQRGTTSTTGAHNRLTANTIIGTDSSPVASAVLELASTTGALVVPRMTSTQRNNLTAVNGMIIYNSDAGAFNFYEAGAWVSGSGLA